MVDNIGEMHIFMEKGRPLKRWKRLEATYDVKFFMSPVPMSVTRLTVSRM